jgi:hypothetical protein
MKRFVSATLLLLQAGLAGAVTLTVGATLDNLRFDVRRWVPRGNAFRPTPDAYPRPGTLQGFAN